MQMKLPIVMVVSQTDCSSMVLILTVCVVCL